MTTIIREPFLSDLDKKEDVICAMMKKLPSSEQNEGKIKRKKGEEEGKERWPVSFTRASKQLFNCVLSKAKATVVNNLWVAVTLRRKG